MRRNWRETRSPQRKGNWGRTLVDTSFLPYQDQEEEENRLREELRQEWEAKQEKNQERRD
ncbi:hypothetical protein U0070_008727 [Myodes glareolus]|uniref:Uncharacterized protein n=1 Tax=Myodes glareolus TaxID=447135 RepID=A0AAW0HGX9_MYOGA